MTTALSNAIQSSKVHLYRVPVRCLRLDSVTTRALLDGGMTNLSYIPGILLRHFDVRGIGPNRRIAIAMHLAWYLRQERVSTVDRWLRRNFKTNLARRYIRLALVELQERFACTEGVSIIRKVRDATYTDLGVEI